MDGLFRGAFSMPTLEDTIFGEGERNREVGENIKFYKLVKENEQFLYPNYK